MVSAGGAAKWVISCLILTAIVWGIIYLGPGVARWIGEQTGGGGTLTIKEISEHPDKYYDQTVTVQGKVIMAIENIGILYQEISQTEAYTIYYYDNTELGFHPTVGGIYKVTGILRRSSGTTSVLYGSFIDVINIEPA